jgi:hypothetical protein
MSKLFPVNEHPVDRGLRVGVGILLVALAATGTVGVWGYIGIVPILTGALGSCPLYTVFGFSTCPVKKTA